MCVGGVDVAMIPKCQRGRLLRQLQHAARLKEKVRAEEAGERGLTVYEAGSFSFIDIIPPPPKLRPEKSDKHATKH